MYSSLNVIRTIKSRRIKWARHAARIGEMINILHKILAGKPGRGYVEDLDIGKRQY
jgi:hypothetical protein